jgi:hypothetical protein
MTDAYIIQTLLPLLVVDTVQKPPHKNRLIQSPDRGCSRYVAFEQVIHNPPLSSDFSQFSTLPIEVNTSTLTTMKFCVASLSHRLGLRLRQLRPEGIHQGCRPYLHC